MNVKHLIFLTILISNVQCLPRLEGERQFRRINSTNNLGSFGTTEANATAHGLGSTVGVSGIVSGDTSFTSGLTSSPTIANNSNLAVASQANCSETSSSSANGTTFVETTTGGNCLLNLNHRDDDPQKVVIGMGAQASTNASQQNNPHSSSINQVTSQNPQAGYAEAYQSVTGPQPTSSFSGVMAAAQPQGGQIPAGTSETMMFHSIGTGITQVETVLTPFVFNPPTPKNLVFN